MQHHDIFISYSSKDKLTADKICSFLEANGVRCWITPRDVLPGSNWGESIIDAINDARAMVLVFSSNCNVSNHIKREVERAVSRGKAIIPFRIEDVMPSKSLEYFISAQHWLDAYTPPLEKHLQHLAKTIKILLSKIGEGPVMVEPAPEFEPQPEVQIAPPESLQFPPAQEETIPSTPRVAEIEPAQKRKKTSLIVVLGLSIIPITFVIVAAFFWLEKGPTALKTNKTMISFVVNDEKSSLTEKAPSPGPSLKESSRPFLPPSGLPAIKQRDGLPKEKIASVPKDQESKAALPNLATNHPQVPIHGKEARNFVNNYLMASSNNNLNEVLNCYAPVVNYFDKGVVTEKIIKKDKLDYFTRWPIRQYTIVGEILVNDVTNELKVVEFRINFVLQDSKNTIKGIADNKWQIKKINNQFKIVNEKQQVISRDKQ